MTPRALKSSTIAALMLAIALLVVSLASGLRASAITGPEALVVTPRGEVWIGVGRELWRASSDGHLKAAMPLSAANLRAPPASLVRHPDGHIVASIRGDAGLYVLDPDTARVTGVIVPRWPADLESKGRDASNVAFAPDGRFAIATGGGHAVALFDPKGAFLARTAPDTYRFTNGLWWSGDELWTTDTNRGALRNLDGRTLAVKRSATLPDENPARFLGPARESLTSDPTVALIRYRNGMIAGRVALVRADGTETPLPSLDEFEPIDVEWLGDDLLATDGASLSIRRWTAGGHVADDFGDAGFAQRLRDLGTQRGALWTTHRWSLRAGVAVFVVAFALLFALKRAEARMPPDARAAAAQALRPIDLSQLGTPLPAGLAIRKLNWRYMWPLMAVPLLSLVPRVDPFHRWLQAAMPHDPTARLAVLAVYLVAAFVVAISLARTIGRKSRMPEFEPVLNALAVRRLRQATAATLPLADGEHVIETFMLRRRTTDDRGRFRRGGSALRWSVCTDRSLRLYGGAGASQWLDEDIPLGDIVQVVAKPPVALGSGRWTAARNAARQARGGWLGLTLADGRVVEGLVVVLPLHARLAQRLEAVAAANAGAALASADTPRAPAPAPVTRGPTRAQAALASLVLPGFGQWWQRRPGMGLLLFLPWVVLLLARTIPVAWTVLGTRADVSTHTIASTLALQFGYALLASWDAWQAGRPARG